MAAYRTMPVPVDRATAELIADADAVTLTSSSTVTNLCRAVGVEGVPPVIASIGPITSATARSLGLAVTVEAEPHTVEGLVEALVRHLAPSI